MKITLVGVTLGIAIFAAVAVALSWIDGLRGVMDAPLFIAVLVYAFATPICSLLLVRRDGGERLVGFAAGAIWMIVLALAFSAYLA